MYFYDVSAAIAAVDDYAASFYGCTMLLGVYTFRSSDRPLGPTGLSDWSVRRSYRVNASSDRSEESNMFDFVRLPIRLSKRVDTTSDWSYRLASRTTNHAAA